MPGRLYDLGSYPAAVFDAAAPSRVLGDVWRLPAEAIILKEIDGYEGYVPDRPDQSLFVRDLQPVTMAEGAELPCWIYLYQQNLTTACQITSGDYAAWLSSQRKQNGEQGA
jgi:gamma-glutamylcyclotransferase (GGCT)/AIG2-like uncharacterized protein YtfP